MRPILVVLAFLALPALAGGPDAVTPDGGRYYGPLVDGKLHGRGRIEWANGIRYEGGFADGLLEGRGRIELPGREVYEGEFRQGMYWGKGELRYRDGRVYIGDFVRDDFNGKGRYEYPEDGGVYEGDFKDDEFTGQGRYARKDGSSYEGAFRNWKFHAPGRYTDASGNTYEGNFVDGSLEGHGTIAGEGRRYEGQLKAWRFHGRGVLRHANGDVYEGNFEHGMYEGEGTLTYAKPRADGRTRDTGVWRYGSLRDEAQARKILADAETALYQQGRLLDKALASLKPGDRRRVEMYLLGVAGDGSQEVFRREVDFVQQAFAERFGTGGRSVALLNSRNTLTSAPMATVTSIRAALKAIGERMDREQDILFFFLTSHGSREHELSLNQAGMPLRGLRAQELGQLLKESGIRWKVVVVSACYSGGFIDALQDEGTLVITAARRDRRSFGCADENDFTYFGRAFFKESLPKAGSFQQAFRNAAVLVEEWERKEAPEAAKAAGNWAGPTTEFNSLPQIHSPKGIEAQLERWWAGLPSSR